MRARSRIILTVLILVALVWLKGQFEKLQRTVLELDRLSQSDGLFSHLNTSPDGADPGDKNPLDSVVHAISNELIVKTVENLATSKSAYRDTRSKTVVVAKLMKENTDWIPRLLPNWQHAIYVTDNQDAPLHTTRNKGREANAYLEYIIQNYDDLPDTIAFVHSHIRSWHNEQNAAKALQLLNIDFVQSNGYVNLRCQQEPGCPVEIHPFRKRGYGDIWKIGTHERKTEQAYAAAWMHLFNTTKQEVPEDIGVACCAQFAVSKTQVMARPKAEYLWYHSWLMDTSLSDQVSGRILEYTWHVIFGRDAVYCPTKQQCYKDVYNQWNVA